jgi:hypothetical protein
MIDPQACNAIVPKQVKYNPVNVIKHLRQFHANRREVIDVEETAIVNFVGRNPPVC